MARIDTDQLNRNRRFVANDSILDTPWNAAFEDSDNDVEETVFGSKPINRVGLVPEDKE